MQITHFGKFLRSQIERLGIKKKDAAARIGVEPVTLRSWFGQAVPRMRPENRANIAKLLGISLEDLWGKIEQAMKADPAFRARKAELEKRWAESTDFVDRLATWEEMKEEGLAADSVNVNALQSGMAGLDMVVEWFKGLTPEDRQYAISQLDLYAGNVLQDIAKAVKTAGDQIEGLPAPPKRRGSRKAAS